MLGSWDDSAPPRDDDDEDSDVEASLDGGCEGGRIFKPSCSSARVVATESTNSGRIQNRRIWWELDGGTANNSRSKLTLLGIGSRPTSVESMDVIAPTHLCRRIRTGRSRLAICWIVFVGDRHVAQLVVSLKTDAGPEAMSMSMSMSAV